MAARLWKVGGFVLCGVGVVFLAMGLWIPAKALLAQQLLQYSWQQSLNTGKLVKPWPWADTYPVGRLHSERLNVDLIVLEGQSGEVLAFGPGHLPGSSPPGEPGNCILAGHRDTSFRFLKDLMAADTLVLEGQRKKSNYQVLGAEVIHQDKLYLDSESDGHLTLITCFPFNGVGSSTVLRYVVTAKSIAEENFM